MRIQKRYLWLVALALFLLGADQPNETPNSNAKSRLQQLQSFIGQWRGVGQLRPGSTEDFWKENSEWKWSFGEEGAALGLEAANGKYFQAGKLHAGEKAGEYVLTLIADKTELKFQGLLDEDGVLTVNLNEPPKDYAGPTSVSFRQVANGDRLLVNLHRSLPNDQMISMGAIGYTRVGSNFGKGRLQVECIITGGKAAIPVVYMDKTYYVCCGGCRDYFYEDPKRALAEYDARKAKEKKEKEEQEDKEK